MKTSQPPNKDAEKKRLDKLEKLTTQLINNNGKLIKTITVMERGNRRLQSRIGGLEGQVKALQATLRKTGSK